jgi:hypothetical protein
MKHTQLSSALANREDEFSQLLSKLVSDEHVDGLLVSRSGLSGEEHDALTSLREDAHAKFRKELDEATSRLRELLARGDPLYTLAVIQASNLIGGWGAYYEPTHSGLEGKVELVAGLLLTQPVPGEGSPISDGDMQSIHDELDRIGQLTLLRNMTAPRGEDATVAELRFTSAMNWMTLRGTSYAHHGTDLAAALFRPYDQWCLTRYGFTFDDVLHVGEAAQSLLTERLNALLDEGRDLATTVIERTDLDAPDERASVAQRVAIGAFQRGVREAMSFLPGDLTAAGLPQDRVKAVLEELSIAVGSLDPASYRGLFDKSPLVERPFLELGGRFVMVVPGMVLRDTVALLEDRFLRGVTKFSKARAETLDRLAVDYLTTLLPGSEGFTHLHYDDAELDGLVIFEKTAFVVEGKGSALSVQAQRGDLVRLASDLGHAVEDAWVQGARAREYLLQDGDATFLDERGSELLRLAQGSIEEVVIVNPTLHQLAGHAPQLPRMRSLGLFPADEFPWSVFINDLRVISETADNAAVFLHYLVWRARLPLGERITVMDELDLWGSYLLCERFAALADDQGHQIVGNSSTDFDAYYAGVTGEGPKQARPRKFLEKPVTGFVDRMASERPAGWREAAGACLDLSIPELAFVVGEARSAWRRANAAETPDVTERGRVRLIGVPRGQTLPDVLAETESQAGEATFHIYVRGSKAKRGEIAWAKRMKTVTFQLSDYESAVLAAAGHARSHAAPTVGEAEPPLI